MVVLFFHPIPICQPILNVTQINLDLSGSQIPENTKVTVSNVDDPESLFPEGANLSVAGEVVDFVFEDLDGNDIGDRVSAKVRLPVDDPEAALMRYDENSETWEDLGAQLVGSPGAYYLEANLAHFCIVGVLKAAPAEAPNASPSAGTVESGTKVALSSATNGAKIYYTDDGTNPVKEPPFTGWTEYTTEITIDADKTIKAFATAPNMKNSETKTFEYTVSQEPIEENQPPTVVNPISDITATVGEGSFTVDVSNTFADADGDDLELTATSSNEAIATVTIDGTILTITPVAEGTATITVTANDGELGVDVTFDVTVQAAEEENQAPTANEVEAKTLTIGESDLTILASELATDPDGDALSVTDAVYGTSGIVDLDWSTGNLVLSPVGEGTTSVTASVYDDGGLGVDVTFDVTVQAAQSVIQAVYSSADGSTLDSQLDVSEVSGETVYNNPNGDAGNYLVVTFSEDIEGHGTIKYSYDTNFRSVGSVVYDVYEPDIETTVTGQVYLPIKVSKEGLSASNYYKIDINELQLSGSASMQTVTFYVYQE